MERYKDDITNVSPLLHKESESKRVYHKIFHNYLQYLSQSYQMETITFIEWEYCLMIKNIPYYSISKEHSIYEWQISIIMPNDKKVLLSQITRILQCMPPTIDDSFELADKLSQRMMALLRIKGVVVTVELAHYFFFDYTSNKHTKYSSIKKGELPNVDLSWV